MDKCKLCKVNDLDNTGAHVITESLVRPTISEEGSKGRDNEILYSLSGRNFGKRFIGRKISEEKILELQGDALTEQQLVENSNPILDYNLVCRSCENKFNPIETFFMQDTKSKIENCENIQLVLNSKHYQVTLLFIVINMWRLAESDSKEFVLPDEVKEDLRVLIEKLEKKSIDEVLGDIDFSTGSLSKIRFSMMYMRHDSGNKSANTIALGSNAEPLFMVLGQLVFTVFFDFDKIGNYKIPSLICEITSKNKIRKQILRQPEELIIQYISDFKRLALNKKIFRHEIKYFWANVNNITRKCHIKFYKCLPTIDVFKYVHHEIRKLPRGFELSDVDEIIARVIMDCGVYYKKNGLPRK
ncbi:MAG: hypothetical protein IPK35_23385 [Saprospiraceae bacterium]|nr:hypothetical protein [Saprospiraceae bacterium]